MPFAADTDPEARRVALEAIRRMSPSQRLHRALQMTSTLEVLTRAGVERDLAGSSPESRHEEFLRRWLGSELGESVVQFRRAKNAGEHGS